MAGVGPQPTLSADKFMLSPEGKDELAPLQSQRNHSTLSRHLICGLTTGRPSLFSKATGSQPQKYLWYVYEAHVFPLKPITFFVLDLE